MRYCNDTWLVYKGRFVLVFLLDKRHYEHISTSRVDRAHAALKKGLGHQQVRVYVINTLIFVFLLKTPKFYTGHLLVVDSAVRLVCERQFLLLCRNMQQSGQLSTWY